MSERSDQGAPGGEAVAEALGEPRSPRGSEGDSAGAAADTPESLLERASNLIAAGKYDLAVGELSSALKRPGNPAGLEGQLLLRRAQAYCAISKQLREIPAAQSERRAIYAPDPMHLAGLGLKDAEGALKAGADRTEAQLRKAQALLLLERYGEAEEAAQGGLDEMEGGDSKDPLREELRSVLAACQAALEGGAAGAAAAAAATPDVPAGEPSCSRKRQRLLKPVDEAECVLCCKLLYEPVTTPCGHSFCRPCFSRAMDHASRCPMCRTVLHAGRELPVTVTLKALLEKSFPEEYAARREEETAAAGAAAAGEGAAPIPLFVMSPMLPGEVMALNIFEPRYRLMVRRCMEGSRRFGMATVDASHQLHQTACEVEITECQPLPDGRFYLEILGRRRFHPDETVEQDGYRLCRQPGFVTDAPVEPGSPEADELAALAADAETLADSWVGRLRALAQARRGVAELLHRAGSKPPTSDLERFSFWVANLACPLLDDDGAKLRFLSTTSTLERLREAKEVLARVRDSGGQACAIM